MATTMPGLCMVEANVGNYGLLACTKKSWANKVRETANGIAKCARNSFAIPLPIGRFMHDVGTVGGGQVVTSTFARARVIGSGPSAADCAKPTTVRVTGFPGIAPSALTQTEGAAEVSPPFVKHLGGSDGGRATDSGPECTSYRTCTQPTAIVSGYPT
jgi:hypothetical protein